MKSKFGPRLKQLRLEKKITQEELANLLNVHKGTVSNWENGNRFPDEKTLLVISEILDCSIDYLLGKVNNKNVINVDTEEKADKIANDLIQILIDTGEITKEEIETGQLSDDKRERLIKKIRKAVKFAQEFDEI